MASGRSSKALRSARSTVVSTRTIPWGGIAAGTVITLFAAVVFGYVYFQGQEKAAREAALAPFTPTDANHDPSSKIPGILIKNYEAGLHVPATDRVAYSQSPPFGGSHDVTWAACNGVVYSDPVRSENMVHSIEHGAVWIAYNPDQIRGGALDTLKSKVNNQPFMILSPYPGLDQPISLQSWGHQLKLSDPNDIRIDQFIQALRKNKYKDVAPEPDGSCVVREITLFNQDAPPPFEAPPPARDAGKPGIVAEDEAGVPTSEGAAGATPSSAGAPGQ